MNYIVGQIIYVVMQNDVKIHPMQIVEEITKKTIDSSTTNYVVENVGNDPRHRTLITDIKGEIFDSAEKVQTTLIERATGGIKRHVALAVQRANECFNVKTPKNHTEKDDMSDNNNDVVMVTLPDGTNARVKLPTDVT